MQKKDGLRWKTTATLDDAVACNACSQNCFIDANAGKPVKPKGHFIIKKADFFTFLMVGFVIGVAAGYAWRMVQLGCNL